ncbi:MAG: glycosyltransferase family 9 protein [Pyrinomonadaceae bacterium]
MKSLRANPEPAFAVSQMLAAGGTYQNLHDTDDAKSLPQPLAPARWDWQKVKRVLVVRLRSIGDTVLATPSLYALRRFLPHAQIDILLEDWVAPVLDESPDVDRVVRIEGKSAAARLRTVRELRAARYDVAFNLHGGTTATFLTAASGARHRVGYASYRYSRLHNHAAPSAAHLWSREETHSVENQLALLGWTGVPVTDLPPTRLAVTHAAAASLDLKLRTAQSDTAKAAVLSKPFAIIHPAAAFASKQWATENFARVAEMLYARGLECIAIAAPEEAETLATLLRTSSAPIIPLTHLSLPEVAALARRTRLFVGNDSGIAHIAAAVRAPSVVVFGSSSITRWRPWTRAPYEVVREAMPCAPCPGYTCAEFDAPECIRRVSVSRVTAAIERVLAA